MVGAENTQGMNLSLSNKWALRRSRRGFQLQAKENLPLPSCIDIVLVLHCMWKNQSLHAVLLPYKTTSNDGDDAGDDADVVKVNMIN